MGFDAAGDEVVAEGDGAAHTVFADVEEFVEEDDEASGVAL